MADFRNLARNHNKLVDSVKEIAAANESAHKETRTVVSQVIGAHNAFVGMSLRRRLRWLIFGDTGKP